MAKKTKSRYELKEKLGEGGRGEVCRAFVNALSMDVALIMRLDVNNSTALSLSCEECYEQSSLAYPNHVEIRDVGVLDESGSRQPCLLTLLRDTALAAAIRASPQTPPTARSAGLISQICRSLQAAHDFSLLRRDIKPRICDTHTRKAEAARKRCKEGPAGDCDERRSRKSDFQRTKAHQTDAFTSKRSMVE
jgi:serine/threonine-protein kinase